MDKVIKIILSNWINLLAIFVVVYVVGFFRRLKQLKKYKDELTSPATIKKYPEFKNINWKMILDTY